MTVYQLPSEPDVTEQKDKKGRRTGWSIRMQITITRKDNRLIGNQWEHPTTSYPKQQFDAHYTRESAASYFLMHHKPDGEEISEERYLELRATYQSAARAAK